MFTYKEFPIKECKDEADVWKSRINNNGKILLEKTPIIDKATPIGAAGSCFAMEITNYLKINNYNYLITEDNKHSCAAWGTLYNTPSFRQLVEFGFGLRDRPAVLFECDDSTDQARKLWDPFREAIYFESVGEYEVNIEKHRIAVREALLNANVFIMTVGLTEVWRLAYDNSVLARYPRSSAFHLFYKQVLTVEENVDELQRMLDIWKAYNPDLKIIITVSPVPLYATFRADETHVITASFYSKSVLRLAVDYFSKQNEGTVFYFPAFETVMYCASNPWEEDCRHVTRETVAQVMSLFEQTFLIS